MWHILMSEIKYNKNIFFMILLLSLFSFILLHNWVNITDENPANQNIGYNSLNNILSFFILILFSSPWIKEKRTRLHAQLPISPICTALARFTMFFIFWIIFVFLFYLYQFCSQYFIFDKPTLYSLWAQTGVAFIIYSIVFLGNDFLHCFSREKVFFKISKRNLFIITLILIGILVTFISVAAIVQTYQNHYPLGQINKNIFAFLYRTITGVFMLTVLGLGLAVLEIFTFKNRKSFVE